MAVVTGPDTAAAAVTGPDTAAGAVIEAAAAVIAGAAADDVGNLPTRVDGRY